MTKVRIWALLMFLADRLSAFVDMLNEMRFGNLSAKSIQTFKKLSREIEYDDGLGPTELCVILSLLKYMLIPFK